MQSKNSFLDLIILLSISFGFRSNLVFVFTFPFYLSVALPPTHPPNPLTMNENSPPTTIGKQLSSLSDKEKIKNLFSLL